MSLICWSVRNFGFILSALEWYGPRVKPGPVCRSLIEEHYRKFTNNLHRKILHIVQEKQQSVRPLKSLKGYIYIYAIYVLINLTNISVTSYLEVDP